MDNPVFVQEERETNDAHARNGQRKLRVLRTRGVKISLDGI